MDQEELINKKINEAIEKCKIEITNDIINLVGEAMNVIEEEARALNKKTIDILEKLYEKI